jgi:acetyl esterase/lipase
VHGGSFIEGDLDMAESHCVATALAERGIWVVATDYRKALGGVTYPAPVDDVEDSWRWFTSQAARHALSPAKLIVGGASAGACIAASLALRARTRSLVSPAGVVLAYPLLHPSIRHLRDDESSLLADTPEAVEFSPSDVASMALNYVGDLHLLSSGAAFPGLADLRGFPATLLIASERDSLRDSAERFDRSARAAGVPVEYYREPGAVHGHLGGTVALTFIRSVERIEQWIAATVSTGARP